MLKKCAITVQVKQVEKMFKNFLYNAWLDVKKKKIIRGFINNYINVTHRYRSRTVVCKHLNTKKKKKISTTRMQQIVPVPVIGSTDTN